MKVLFSSCLDFHDAADQDSGEVVCFLLQKRLFPVFNNSGVREEFEPGGGFIQFLITKARAPGGARALWLPYLRLLWTPTNPSPRSMS